MIYYDIVIEVGSQIIQSVGPMTIMMIFNMSTSYFSQKIVSIWWGLFNDATDLRVRMRVSILPCHTPEG